MSKLKGGEERRETSEWNDGECARETGRGVCVPEGCVSKGLRKRGHGVSAVGQGGACKEVLCRIVSSAEDMKKQRRGDARGGGRFDRKTCDGLSLERGGAGLVRWRSIIGKATFFVTMSQPGEGLDPGDRTHCQKQVEKHGHADVDDEGMDRVQ